MTRARPALTFVAVAALGGCGVDEAPPPRGDPPSGWVAIGGATDRAPAAVRHDGATFVFARGADGRVRVASSDDDRSWSAFRAIDGVTTDAAPTAASFGGAARVFVRSDVDGRIHQATSAGVAWSPVADLASDVAPAATAFDGRLFLFTVGADGAITWSSSADGATWAAASTRGASATAVAAASVDGVLALSWIDVAGDALHVATSADGRTWIDGAPIAAPGRALRAASMATFDHDLYVTVVDADTGHVWSNVTRSPVDAPRWGGWFEVPPRDRTTDVGVGSISADDGVRWYARDPRDGRVLETRTPTYDLPFASADGWRLATGNVDDPVAGHGPGDYSFDFAHAEDGTEVRAMRDGEVVLFENDETCTFFEDWQCVDGAPCCSVVSEACLADDGPKLGNVVLIQHDDGTVASYNHLAPGSIPAGVRACGARVRRGDVVGAEGHTGAVCGVSHVHVGVLSGWSNANGACAWGGAGYPDRRGIDFRVPSLPIYFRDAHHAAWRPVVGDPLAP